MIFEEYHHCYADPWCLDRSTPFLLRILFTISVVSLSRPGRYILTPLQLKTAHLDLSPASLRPFDLVNVHKRCLFLRDTC